MNKKKIIIVLLAISLLLVGGYFLKQTVEKRKISLKEKGIAYYDKIHNLYFFRENVDYKTNENNQREYIEIDNKKYYEISNYEEVFKKLITEKMLLKTNAYLNIRLLYNKYYMKDYGRGLSGYYGTELEIKKSEKNKIEYKALSKFCEKEYRVSYGDGCSNEKYYYIEKPFILVKEDGIWKVDEYTSVFEFDDSLIK